MNNQLAVVDFKPVYKENLNKTDILLLSKGDNVYRSFYHAVKTQEIFVSFLGCFILGTAAVGHTDKIGRLKELCEQYGIWLHVEG